MSSANTEKPRLFGHFVAGQWIDQGQTAENLNPADTRDCVGHFVLGDAAIAHRALEAAREAFGSWSKSNVQARSDILDRIGTEILARRDELGLLLCREEGKTLAEATGEIVRAGQIFRFFAGEALRIPGELLDSVRPGIRVEVTREALGVVLAITPWNFPAAIPAWKIAPALAYGNCVILKPSELTPGTAWAFADIIARSGLPAGVFGMVLGTGPAVGPALIEGVDAVSFTGSVPTGRRVAQQAVEHMARVQLEMGGKNPLVVLDDADLQVAVDIAVNGAFFQTGQRCTASSRLIVTQGIHDRFVAAVTERVAALRVGDGRRPDTQMGPAIDERQLEKNLSYVKIAVDEGAQLATGGQRLSLATPGHFMSPALLTGTDNRMRINREEVFGPVASVIRVKDYEEALATANDTEFGLVSGIATTSHKYATHFRANAKTGLVMVNLPTAGLDFHVPFGGRKASSYGPREQGRAAVEFYTIMKTAYVSA